MYLLSVLDPAPLPNLFFLRLKGYTLCFSQANLKLHTFYYITVKLFLLTKPEKCAILIKVKNLKGAKMNLGLSGFKKVSLLLVLVGVFCLTDMINPASGWSAKLMITAQKGDLNYPDYTSYGRVTYDYYIGKYETTHTEYCDFLNAVDPGGSDEHDLHNSYMTNITYSGGSYFVTSGWENKPIDHVNWYDAARFCNWLHNDHLTPGSTETEAGAYNFDPGDSLDSRGYDDTYDNDPDAHKPDALYWIPTRDEWYKAAYYDPDKNDGDGGYYDYPTGSDTAPTAESPPGGNNSANFYSAVGHITDVGAYVSSPSPWGTFDQGGNLYEWIEEWGSSTQRVLRGGSWKSPLIDLDSGGELIDNPELLASAPRGFRVASAVPEPATFLLFSSGLLGLLPFLRRRKK